MPGFVKTNMDIKRLILFALAKIDEPATFEELCHATMIDDGVNYFLLKQSADALLIPENITLEDERYAITKRGRQNLENCQDDIPITLRKKSAVAIKEVNQAQEKRRFVQSSWEEQADGTAMVHLSLENKEGLLFQMNMQIPTPEEAEKISRSFQKDSITYFFALRDVAQGLTLPPGELFLQKNKNIYQEEDSTED